MRIAMVICTTALVACGSKSGPKEGAAGSGSAGSAAPPSRFAKHPQPKVSAVCAKARFMFGYGSDCIETPLPELTSPAGKVVRVVRKGDPTMEWAYMLVKPDGAMESGDGGINGHFLRTLGEHIDFTAQPPELLAKLVAGISVEAAVVRCLPGSNDTLPACTPPTLKMKDGKGELTFVIEEFPHPKLLNRTDHRFYRETYTVEAHALHSRDGDGLGDLPVTAPLPKDAPPLPVMTTPPSWVAAPEKAPADVSAALCAEAVKQISGFEGRACQAYAYPSLTLPTGALFYLANDAGQANVHALKKPDGTIAVGYALETDSDPLLPIIKSYDPKVVPPAKLLAAHLWLASEPVHILCLPGSNDVIPDATCDAPTATTKDGEVIVTGIVEELPLPNGHGMVSDPAVRSFSYEFSPGGGVSGGGTRLVDMRDN